MENLKENNIWFIIQGPLDYYNQVKVSYNNFENVVWSTWKNEASKLINEKHKILNSYPIVRGKQNINLQVKTTLNGLKYAKKQGAKYVFKIRSDMVFSDLELLISKLKFDNVLYFPAYHTWEDGYFVDYFQFGPIDKMIKLWSIPLKFAIFHKKYPEYYIKQNFVSKFPNEKVRYIMPICIKNNINIYWLKNQIDLTHVVKSDNLFVFDEYNMGEPK